MAKGDRPIFDMSNAGVKRMAKRLIDQCEGLWWFELTKCRDQRTLAQNAYYWGVALPHFAGGLTQAWGETITVDEAHIWCRRQWLSRPIVDRTTGEIVDQVVRSTADLDTAEFGEYLDKIIRHAAEYLDVEIPIALRPARKEVA